MILYKPIYTIEEAALELRLNLSDIYHLIESERLPGILIESQVRIRGNDLEKFVNSCDSIFGFSQFVEKNR